MTTTAHDAPDRLLEHAAFVRAVARAVLGRDEAAVEDAVQETWVVALERGQTRRGALRPWLGGVARLTALALRRRRRRARDRDRVASRTEATAAADDLAARAEVGRRVVDAVLALEDPYRTVVLLRFYDGVGPREIARRLDVPYETARTHLRRGLARLRDDLVERSEDPEKRRAALVPLAWGRGGEGPSGPSLMPWLAGGIAVKKVVVLAAVAVLALGGFFLVRTRSAGEERSRAAGSEPPTAAGIPVEAGRERPAHLAGRGASEEASRSRAYPAPVDLAQVDRERDLHGRILGEDGIGLPGARLQVVHYPWRDGALIVEPALYDEAVVGATCHSASDGSYRVRLEPGQFAYLRVEAQGYAPLERARLSAGERVDITMHAGVSLALHVRGPDGDPAVGTRLLLCQAAADQERTLMTWATTDAEGRAHFEDLPPDFAVRLIAYPTVDGQGMRMMVPFVLPDRGERSEEITLPGGWVLRGRVADAETSRPVGGARVATSWNFVEGVETDVDGRFVLPGVTAAWNETLHVVAEGYARTVLPIRGRRTVDVVLSRGCRVVGRAVDPAGQPVADALLRAIGGRSLRNMQDRSLAGGRTAADGTFSLGGLTEGVAHTLVVKAPGYGKTLVDFDLGDAEAVHDLGDVRLASSGRVVGRVLDVDGKALARVTVELKGWNEDRSARRGSGAGVVTSTYGSTERRASDDRGRFSFVDVAPGTYALEIPDARGSSPPVDVTVRAGEELQEVVLQQRPGREVRFTIQDDVGDPVPGANVQVRDQSAEVADAVAGADGSLVLALPRKPLTIFAWVGGDSTYETKGPLPLGVEDQEIAIVLGRTRALMARLVGPDGKPLPLAVLRVQEGAVSHRCFTNGDGVFGLKVKGASLLSIYFHGSFQDAASYGRQYTLPLIAEMHDVSPEVKDLVVRAEAVAMDRSISVRLLDPSGNPVAGVQITPWPTMKGVGAQTRATDEAGRALFGNLPALPLAYYVKFTHTADRPWIAPPLERAVPAGGEIVLRLREGGWISGRVIVPEGVPYAKVYVYARDPETDAHRGYAQLDEEGRFRLLVDPALGPSRIRVTHYDPRGRKHEAVADGAEPGEDLTLTLTR